MHLPSVWPSLPTVVGECFYLLLLVLFFGGKEKSCMAEAVTGTRSQKAGCPKGTMVGPRGHGEPRKGLNKGETVSCGFPMTTWLQCGHALAWRRLLRICYGVPGSIQLRQQILTSFFLSLLYLIFAWDPQCCAGQEKLFYFFRMKKRKALTFVSTVWIPRNVKILFICFFLIQFSWLLREPH